MGGFQQSAKAIPYANSYRKRTREETTGTCGGSRSHFLSEAAETVPASAEHAITLRRKNDLLTIKTRVSTFWQSIYFYRRHQRSQKIAEAERYGSTAPYLCCRPASTPRQRLVVLSMHASGDLSKRLECGGLAAALRHARLRRKVKGSARGPQASLRRESGASSRTP